MRIKKTFILFFYLAQENEINFILATEIFLLICMTSSVTDFYIVREK
jgi:hypothetical protein